jgi:hypothetical protein
VIAAVAVVALVVGGLATFLLARDDSSEATREGAAPAIGNADPTTPTGTVRAHWEAIGVGDYEAAYAQLSDRFREDNPREEWVDDLRADAPVVNLVGVSFLRALDSENAELAVEVVTRDTAGEAGERECVRFDGRVRVVNQDGLWRYRADGPGDSFERRGELPPTDPRCEPLR